MNNSTFTVHCRLVSTSSASRRASTHDPPFDAVRAVYVTRSTEESPPSSATVKWDASSMRFERVAVDAVSVGAFQHSTTVSTATVFASDHSCELRFLADVIYGVVDVCGQLALAVSTSTRHCGPWPAFVCDGENCESVRYECASAREITSLCLIPLPRTTYEIGVIGADEGDPISRGKLTQSYSVTRLHALFRRIWECLFPSASSTDARVRRIVDAITTLEFLNPSHHQTGSLVARSESRRLRMYYATRAADLSLSMQQQAAWIKRLSRADNASAALRREHNSMLQFRYNADTSVVGGSGGISLDDDDGDIGACVGFFPEQLDDFSWTTPVIKGYYGCRVVESATDVSGRETWLVLVARVSPSHDGPRYIKRGSDANGDVGNSVESETVVLRAAVGGGSQTMQCASYVVYRGSVPLVWTQHVDLSYKPVIKIDPNLALQRDVLARHVMKLRRYFDPVGADDAAFADGGAARLGRPAPCVVAVDLLSHKSSVESRLHEMYDRLGRNAQEDIIHATWVAGGHGGQSHWTEEASAPPFAYSSVDIGRGIKRVKTQFMRPGKGPRVAGTISHHHEFLREEWLFGGGTHSALRLCLAGSGQGGHGITVIRTAAATAEGGVVGGTAVGSVVSVDAIQRGVVRINCLDCVDRSNLVAFLCSKYVVEHQVRSHFPLSAVDWRVARDALSSLWVDHGNAISVLYAGSPSLFYELLSENDAKLSIASTVRDGRHAVRRYWQNNTSDGAKQDMITVLTSTTRNVHGAWRVVRDLSSRNLQLHFSWSLICGIVFRFIVAVFVTIACIIVWEALRWVVAPGKGAAVLSLGKRPLASFAVAYVRVFADFIAKRTVNSATVAVTVGFFAALAPAFARTLLLDRPQFAVVKTKQR